MSKEFYSRIFISGFLFLFIFILSTTATYFESFEYKISSYSHEMRNIKFQLLKLLISLINRKKIAIVRLFSIKNFIKILEY